MPLTDTALAAVMYAPGSVIPANLKQIAAILYGGNVAIPANLLQLALANRGATLATGQTTQYASKLDDGYYQKGLAKSYTILTAGQYSGTTAIDIVVRTRVDTSFTAPSTITTAQDYGSIRVGDTIRVAGSVSNNGIYTVANANLGVFTVNETTIQNENAGATITIAKRELHSNACVLDNNTGLMWSRTASDKVGLSSDGMLPWTRQGAPEYDVFSYPAVAITAALAGYTDWRLPSKKDWETLIVDEQNPAGPNSTAFPSLPATPIIWTSSTSKKTTTNAWAYRGDLEGEIEPYAKSNVAYVLLVRGG